MSTMSISPPEAHAQGATRRALLWKEYREQRAFWLALAALALLVILGLGSMARGGLAGLPEDRELAAVVAALVYGVVFGYGVICGALLLAGDKENATLDFLDAHLGARRPVWQAKLLAGVLLTVPLNLVLAGTMLLVGLGPWHLVLVFPLLGLIALCWGLLGGAACRSVLAASLVGGGALIGAAGPGLLLIPDLSICLAVEVAVALWASVASRRVFCATDPARAVPTTAATVGPYAWTALVSLTWRQGRKAFLIGLALCVPAGVLVYLNPVVVWPALSATVGLLCGVAVFGFEQAGAQERFLAALRLPPGRLWLVKSLCWLVMGLVVLSVLGGTAILLHEWNGPPRTSERYALPYVMDGFGRTWPTAWLHFLWPLHGFCVGQLVTLLTRRVVVALFLGAVISGGLLVLWLPSLVLGGLSPWLVLPVPIAFLLLGRLAMWPWLSGRLFTRRPLVVGAACLGLIAAWGAGLLAYRVHEVPDVGEPFDLHAFHARLDEARRREAGPLLLEAFAGLNETAQQVSAHMGQPAPEVLKDWAPSNLPPGPDAYYLALGHALREGWLDPSPQLESWLEQVTAGPWMTPLQKALKLPPGLLLDPRIHGQEHYIRKLVSAMNCGLILSCRALQLQARGDEAGALLHLQAALALSRQLRYFGPTINALRADGIEDQALAVVEHWYSWPAADEKLLRRTLTLLQEHEKNYPHLEDAVQASYLVLLNDWEKGEPRWLMTPQDKELLDLMRRAPWEKERERRLLNALVAAQLQSIGAAPGLDTLDARRLDRLAQHATVHAVMYPTWPIEAQRSGIAHVRAVQTAIALVLYYRDRGTLPDRLEELTPRYLSAVPIDPFRNAPLLYKISGGETVQGNFLPDQRLQMKSIDRGDGILWLTAPRSGTWYFRIPRRF